MAATHMVDMGIADASATDGTSALRVAVAATVGIIRVTCEPAST